MSSIRLAVAAALIAGPVVAAPKKPEPQSVSNQQLHEAIYVLQSVKHTLDKADHDYGGHRAAAVKDIAKAEHQLREALAAHHKGHPPTAHAGHPGKPGHPGHPGGAARREPQSLSDAQLAEAIPVLNATATFLKNANHDYGGHREKAVQDIAAAVRQLQTALQYSKQHDQKKK